MGNLSKYLSLLLLFFVLSDLSGQTYIYKGNSRFPQDLMFNILDGELRSGRNSYGFPALFNIRDEQIYKGESRSLLDVIFTNRDGYLFLNYSDNEMVL